MGSSYVTHTVRATDRKKIGDLLARRKTMVSTASSGVVVVYDKDANAQGGDDLLDLARMLSAGMNAVVFVALNLDDDALLYWLFENGTPIDAYDSCPDHSADVSKRRGPLGGHAHILCKAFASPNVEATEFILRSEEYVSAFDRHTHLVKALGLAPELAGFRYLIADSFTTGFGESGFTEIGGNP
jgi:hypothetical protein